MKGTAEVGEYKLTEDFEEFNRDFDINLTDDKELWLIQWPLHSTPDINGQALTLKLHQDGLLGTFEGSSVGKPYEVVSHKSQEPEATVFLPSSSECTMVGKISRQVSIVHYPDPGELSESNRSVFKRMAERSAATSLTNSANRSPTKGIRSRNSVPSSEYTSTIRGGRNRIVASGSRDTSKVPLRRHADEPVRSIDLSLQDSGRQHSAVTSSGSLEDYQERKSKKIRKS